MGVIITTAGERLMARLQAEGKPLVIDTFIFAEIPGQDYEADIDPGVALPAESRIRLRYPIPEEYRAYVNLNQVVYSALLGSDVGDWAFNWQGLYCSEHQTLVAVATFPAIEKRAYSADTGQPGNNITRNFILEFNGAQKLTRINVSADVWQLDFTVRLAGMDERERLSNYDLYGQGYFDGNGWKLAKQGGGYAFQPGLAYVGGIRAALASALPVPALSKKPCDVWLSVCLKPQGSDRVAEATPLWVEPGVSVADVRDDAGIMHYRARVARVDASGNVTDIRPPEFGDADQPGRIETYLKDNRRYATCATAAATVAKTAALPGFILKPGAWAVVRFSNTNTAVGATLNIGGTGAKPIQYHGKALTAGTPGAGRAYAFIYTGSAYELVGDVLTLAEGGGLSFDAKGHLYVDFSLVPDEQMRAIVLSMMQQGGGLNVDGNGKLYVDFASMPTEKFELMLKSIRVPIWLTGNKSFYVNGVTGSDTLDTGRGESPSKPFKTIQAAVNYVTDNYNLSRYTAYINVSGGLYEEEVVVGSFSVTTGRLYIRKNPESVSKPTIVRSLVSKDCVVLSIQSGGTVYLDGIDVILNVEVTNKLSIEGTGIHVSRYTVVNVLNSTVTLNINSEGTISGLSCIQSSSFAQLNINYCNKLISNYIKGTKPHSFSVGSNAKMSLINLYGEHENDHLSVKGDFNTVCRVMDGYFYRSATKMPLVVADGNVTGSRYQVTQGGAIYIRGGGPHFFPGTTDGSIDESTYSWYK